MPSLTTGDGRTLAWREAGAGPPLLIHPGGPGCAARYFDELPELEAQRTLLYLDPRGTGDSDRPADPHAYDLEDYAADIEAVREHLGLPAIDLVGHSHGGFVAITWAGLHPQRVNRLVLAGTAPRFTDDIRMRRTRYFPGHQHEPYFADALGALARQQAGDYADDADLADLLERGTILFEPPGEEVRSLRWAFRVAGCNADATRHFNDHIAATMDLRGLLARIEAPALVLYGELDAFGPASAQEIADALTAPTVVELPGADHFAFLETDNRTPWSQAILDFLAA